jgi:hypothetical protein
VCNIQQNPKFSTVRFHGDPTGLGRVANRSARHRCLVHAPLKLAGVPNPSRFEGFGFRSNTYKNLRSLAPVRLSHDLSTSFPKRNYPAKIIRAHSLPLLEIAPKPCYKKLHPKYPNNIFVPRQTGPERSRVYPLRRAVVSLPAVAGRGLLAEASGLLGGYVPAVCERDVTMARPRGWPTLSHQPGE